MIFKFNFNDDQALFLPEACDFIFDAKEKTPDVLQGNTLVDFQKALHEEARSLGIWLFYGVHVKNEDPDVDKKMYNAQFATSPHTDKQWRYNKIHLFKFQSECGQHSMDEKKTIQTGHKTVAVPFINKLKVGLQIVKNRNNEKINSTPNQGL